MDVDRVGEQRDPLRVDAAGEHRLAREPPDHEDLRGATEERRDDGALDGPPPARPRVALVRLDEQDVGDAAGTAPRGRRLGGEGAPAGDDDDLRPGGGQRAEHTERDGVLVAQRPVDAGHTAAFEEDGAMARLDRPRASLHGASRVESGEVELGPGRGDPVEHLGAKGGRLGDDQREAHGLVPARAQPRARGCALGPGVAPAP